jgi:DNA-binding MarR family transcriptional regulator
MTASEPADDARLWSRACVLLYVVSLDLSAIAADTLGRGSTGNRDVRAILTLHERPGASPSELADLTEVSRSSLSRTLRRLYAQGLVSRRRDDQDGRAAHLRLTPAAEERVAAFESQIADYLRRSRSTFEDVITLLRGEGAAESASRTTHEPLSPLAVASRLAEVGAVVVDDFMTDAPRYRLAHVTDRAAVLMIHDLGSARPGDLATALHLTSGGSTLLINRLVDNGLVYRQRPEDGADRRAVVVACTPKGSEAASVICSIIQRHGQSLAEALESVADMAWAEPVDAAAG